MEEQYTYRIYSKDLNLDNKVNVNIVMQCKDIDTLLIIAELIKGNKFNASLDGECIRKK